VKRLRSEGERYIGQIRRETTTFACRARAEIESDVRKVRDELRSRADRSLRTSRPGGRRLVESFEKQLTRLADAGCKGTADGGLGELTKLTQRLGILEQRVEQLEHELREALQDQEA
jgi:hypothetical protein